MATGCDTASVSSVSGPESTTLNPKGPSAPTEAVPLYTGHPTNIAVHNQNQWKESTGNIPREILSTKNLVRLPYLANGM